MAKNWHALSLEKVFAETESKKEFVLNAKARIRKRNGNLKKWKVIIKSFGARAEKQFQKIVKCYVKTVIEKNLGNKIN